MKLNKMFVGVVISIWCVMVLLNFFLPKVEFSDSENRFLTRLPSFSTDSLVKGTYMQKVDDYINDHFIGRDTWIAMKSQMEYILGKRENNGVFIGENRLIEDLPPPDAEMVSKNIDGLKRFAEIFRKPAYLLIAPSAESVQSDKLPRFAHSWDQKSFIADVNTQLEGLIKPINIYDTLYLHKDEYIYYKTDHHWTTDGAFLAYQETAAAMGLNLKTFSDFVVNDVSTDFYGTLYSKSGYKNVTADTIRSYEIGKALKMTVLNGSESVDYDTVYFPDFLKVRDKYAYFLNGNQALLTIRTESKSGKKLLVFKDSYAHSMIPMLFDDYSEITVVDLRFLNVNINEMIDINKFDESLFIFSIDMFSHQLNTGKLSWMEVGGG